MKLIFFELELSITVLSIYLSSELQSHFIIYRCNYFLRFSDQHQYLVMVTHLKNFASSLIRKSGCSSAIQCPENGTIPPRTSVASDFIEVNAAEPKLCSPPRANTGIGSLTLACSLFCSRVIGN